MLVDIEEDLRRDKDALRKADMVRRVLVRLNEEESDLALHARRTVVQRVVEFRDFSQCWDNDRLPAQGLVANIREIVDGHDSKIFARKAQESVYQAHQSEAQKAAEERGRRAKRLESVRRDLSALIQMDNPQRRGTALEGVLNELFKASGMLVREAFTVSHDGVVMEQIDGAISLDGHLYLVEMKWHSEKIGADSVTHHLSKVEYRGEARGIMISHSGYTEPGIDACRSALHRKVVVLLTVHELVLLLEQGLDLAQMLRHKVQIAQMDKKPFHDMVAADELRPDADPFRT
jgi:hypothetical protein